MKKVKITYANKEQVEYYIAAENDKFAILSDLDNEWFTYTIIDKKNERLGQDNKIFNIGYDTVKGCGEKLKQLTNGELQLSAKRSERLNDVTVECL